MSSRVALRVRLKVPDTTALSAEDVLARKMGYGDRLERLKREDLWLFEIDADGGARAAERVRVWARRCTALVNPNKHHCEIEALTAWPPPCASGGVCILVRDREDARAGSMASFLKTSFGASDLLSLSFGVLWTLYPGPKVGERGALAEEIAVVRSQRSGLLANPHAQTYEIWE